MPGCLGACGRAAVLIRRPQLHDAPLPPALPARPLLPACPPAAAAAPSAAWTASQPARTRSLSSQRSQLTWRAAPPPTAACRALPQATSQSCPTTSPVRPCTAQECAALHSRGGITAASGSCCCPVPLLECRTLERRRSPTRPEVSTDPAAPAATSWRLCLCHLPLLLQAAPRALPTWQP